jgi:hypothetical protein
MKVVLRETKESRRWLRFLTRCKLVRHQAVGPLEDAASQLAAIFATIYVKRKKNLEAAKSPRT